MIERSNSNPFVSQKKLNHASSHGHVFSIPLSWCEFETTALIATDWHHLSLWYREKEGFFYSIKPTLLNSSQRPCSTYTLQSTSCFHSIQSRHQKTERKKKESQQTTKKIVVVFFWQAFRVLQIWLCWVTTPLAHSTNSIALM